ATPPRMNGAARSTSFHGLLDRSHTLRAMAATHTTDADRIRNAGGGTSDRRRKAVTAAHDTRYASSRTIVLMVNAERNVLNSATTHATVAVTTIAATGVRKRACVRAKIAGRSRFSAIAKTTRGVAKRMALRMPPIETSAAAAASAAPAGPTMRN